MKTTTIDGAIITDDMIGIIKEWQSYGYIDDDLRTIDAAIDMVLEKDDIKDLECKNATKYLQLFIDLRGLSKNLSKFKVEMSDGQ